MSEDEEVSEELIAALKDLINRIKINSKRNIKLLLTFGASTGSEVFLTAINQNREKFIENLIIYCNDIGFDGIDIDYEFPFTKSDYDLYDAFLIDLKKEMSEKMHSKDNSLLSCAFGTKDVNYSKEAIDSINFVNCMTYDIFDQDGQHSSYWGGCIQGAKYLESVGFKKSQINIGIPFYGTQTEALMEQYLYKDLKNHSYFNNEYTVTDYLGKDTKVYFNSPSMARDKTAYAILSGYGGIMTWHSTLDLDVNNKYSLWRAINTAVSEFGGMHND